MRNVRITKTVLAWSLLLMAPLGLATQAAMAGDGQAPALIDKDFETCLRKFISKRFYHRIDATDDQKQKLDSIWMTTMESTRPQREEVRRDALALSDLMASDTATDEQITEKVHELRAKHQKIQDERLNSVLKARKVLTKEQRQKMHDRFQELVTGGGTGLRQRRLSMLMNVTPLLND